MTTVNQDFLPTSYKGVMFPVTSWEVGFSQDLGEHKFLFKDERYIQPQGRTNVTWRATIPFSQNHPTDRGFKDLFIKTFPEFFAACADGEPGPLVTPDLGEFRVACASLSYRITPDMQDGVMVEASWIRAPEIDDFATEIAINPAVTIGILQLQQDYDTVFPPGSPEAPIPPLVDIFTLIRSFNDQILLQRDRILGKWDGALFALRRMENSIEKTGDVANWGIQDRLRRTQLEVHRAMRAVGGDGNQPYRKRLISDTSIDELAAQMNVSVESLWALNPELSQSPIVPASTTVQFIPGR